MDGSLPQADQAYPSEQYGYAGEQDIEAAEKEEYGYSFDNYGYESEAPAKRKRGIWSKLKKKVLSKLPLGRGSESSRASVGETMRASDGRQGQDVDKTHGYVEPIADGGPGGSRRSIEQVGDGVAGGEGEHLLADAADALAAKQEAPRQSVHRSSSSPSQPLEHDFGYSARQSLREPDQARKDSASQATSFDKYDQDSYSSPGLKISVHSIGSLIDDAWGTEAQSILPAEFGSDRALSFREMILQSREYVQHSTLGRLAGAVAHAPLVTLATVARTLLAGPLCAGLCYLIELLLSSKLTLTPPATEYGEDDSVEYVLRQVPLPIRESAGSFFGSSSIARSVLFGVVKTARDAYRPYTPFMVAAAAYMLMHSVVLPSLTKNLCRSWPPRAGSEDLCMGALSVELFARIAGHLVVLTTAAILMQAIGARSFVLPIVVAAASSVLELWALPVSFPNAATQGLRPSDIGSTVGSGAVQTQSDRTRVSFGVVRKYALGALVFLFSFRSLVFSGDPSSEVHFDLIRVTRQLERAMKFIYFRFGIELTLLDDDSLVRSIAAAVVMLVAALPLYCFSCIMESCFGLCKLRTIDLIRHAATRPNLMVSSGAAQGLRKESDLRQHPDHSF